MSNSLRVILIILISVQELEKQRYYILQTTFYCYTFVRVCVCFVLFLGTRIDLVYVYASHNSNVSTVFYNDKK